MLLSGVEGGITSLMRSNEIPNQTTQKQLFEKIPTEPLEVNY